MSRVEVEFNEYERPVSIDGVQLGVYGHELGLTYIMDCPHCEERWTHSLDAIIFWWLRSHQGGRCKA
jgi:hypothetical protein